MIHVQLLAYTPEPEKVCAAAAKLCYSSSDIDALLENLTPEATEKFLNMLMSMGHQSPIEHVSFTFGIEGVSRSLLAQITRHRIASYSVKSQRYVRMDDFEYVTPPEIEKDPEAKALYVQAMKQSAAAYDQLTQILLKTHKKAFLEQGLPEKQAQSKAEKKAIEDARFVLPNACETKMVVTMNARSLLHFFRMRCCQRAQWEIRELADLMLQEVKKVAPVLFQNGGPGCVSGPCPEGKMSCGRQSEIRARYLNQS